MIAKRIFVVALPSIATPEPKSLNTVVAFEVVAHVFPKDCDTERESTNRDCPKENLDRSTVEQHVAEPP